MNREQAMINLFLHKKITNNNWNSCEYITFSPGLTEIMDENNNKLSLKEILGSLLRYDLGWEIFDKNI